MSLSNRSVGIDNAYLQELDMKYHLSLAITTLSIYAATTYAAAADGIQIDIVGKVEGSSADGSPICKLEYELVNDSTGTIYYLRVPIEAWDDRGNKYDQIGFTAYVGNDGGMFAGSVPVALGSSARFTMSNQFRGMCQYLVRVVVNEIDPEDCNIRMLPEDADCDELVSVTSSVEGLDVKNK